RAGQRCSACGRVGTATGSKGEPAQRVTGPKSRTGARGQPSHRTGDAAGRYGRAPIRITPAPTGPRSSRTGTGHSHCPYRDGQGRSIPETVVDRHSGGGESSTVETV